MLGMVLFGSLMLSRQGLMLPSKSNVKMPPPLTVEYRIDDKVDSNTSYYLKVTSEYVDFGRGDDYWDSCENSCRGNVHSKHSDCDLSCDSPCDALDHEHYEFFEPEINDYLERGEGWQRLSSIANNFCPGDCADQLAYHALKLSEAPIYLNSNYYFETVWPCWNTKPCSDSERGCGSRLIRIRLKYQLYKEISGMRAEGPSGTMDYETMAVPDVEDKFEVLYDHCLCHFDNWTALGGLHTKTADDYGGIRLGEKPFSPLIPSKTLDSYNFGITCDSMNSATITSHNPTGMPLIISMFPGTKLISDDPAAQNMLVTKQFSLNVPAWSSASMHVPYGDGIALDPEDPKATGNAVCINMSLHEPNPSIKYRAVGSSGGLLRKLSSFASKERIIGPWVQTRFWIATDQAKLSEVQKVLKQQPTEGHYLRALYEVATVGHVDMMKAKFKGCMEPKMIIGASAAARVTQWFVDTFAKKDPKALADWLTQNHDAFEPLFAEGAQDFAIRHAADVANALCDSRDAGLRAAGVDYLLHTVPEGKRADLIKAKGLDGLTDALVDGDERTVADALSVVEAYKSKAVMFGLMNLSPKATAEQKAKAKELARVMK